jgi:hypothetical protein
MYGTGAAWVFKKPKRWLLKYHIKKRTANVFMGWDGGGVRNRRRDKTDGQR